MTRIETHICLALGMLVLLAVAVSVLGIGGDQVAAAGQFSRLG